MAEPKTKRMLKRVHVYYSGCVQGVGFRFTAEATALALRVKGWVKNLQDRRVELVAEGSQDRLERLLEEMRTGPMGNFIKKTDVTWSDGTGEFRNFDVRYF